MPSKRWRSTWKDLNQNPTLNSQIISILDANGFLDFDPEIRILHKFKYFLVAKLLT